MDSVLCPRLNERIKELGSGLIYSVSDIAPSTFPDLKACSVGILTAYSGASEKTIYGDPRINWIFRTLHDQMHLRYDLDFSLESEIELGRLSASLFEGGLADIVYAEIAGQAKHFCSTGEFPADQTKFITDFLHTGKYTL